MAQLGDSSASNLSCSSSSSGIAEIGMSSAEKGSIVFTIIELLLIALLLLCNCLNLVSVLGFGVSAWDTTSTFASSITMMNAEDSFANYELQAKDFEAWQRAFVGGPTADAQG